MSAVRLFSQEEIARRLAPYKCKLVMKITDHADLWETGWKEPFTLYHELEAGYSQDQLGLFLVFIGKTMPPDWLEKNGNGG